MRWYATAAARRGRAKLVNYCQFGDSASLVLSLVLVSHLHSIAQTLANVPFCLLTRFLETLRWVLRSWSRRCSWTEPLPTIELKRLRGCTSTQARCAALGRRLYHAGGRLRIRRLRSAHARQARARALCRRVWTSDRLLRLDDCKGASAGNCTPTSPHSCRSALNCLTPRLRRLAHPPRSLVRAPLEKEYPVTNCARPRRRGSLDSLPRSRHVLAEDVHHLRHAHRRRGGPATAGRAG